MNTKIENVPKLKTVLASIEAPLYNIARLATIKFETPLRLQLPGHKTIDVILNRNTWVCIDRAMYDLPALAWTHLNHENRQALHTPVESELHYYHIHVNISADNVLESLQAALQLLLANSEPNQPGEVIKLTQP